MAAFGQTVPSLFDRTHAQLAADCAAMRGKGVAREFDMVEANLWEAVRIGSPRNLVMAACWLYGNLDLRTFGVRQAAEAMTGGMDAVITLPRP